MKKQILITIGSVAAIAVLSFAGSLDAPAAPTAVGSASFTLQDICNRLDAGTAGSKRSGAFTEPTLAPASTECSIDSIMAKLPTEDASNAVSPSEVTLGKTYWSLKNGAWGIQTGTGAFSAQTLSADSQTVAAGVYSATTLSTIDSDLVSGNIRAGVSIFGVTGDSNVVNTSSGDATASDIGIGSKVWVDGVEITGTFIDL